MPKRINSLKETLGKRRHVRACIKYKSHEYDDGTWSEPRIACYIENVSDEFVLISQFNPALTNQARAEIPNNFILAICAPDIKLMAIFDRPIESI